MKNEFIRVSSLISFIICFAPVKMFAQSPPGAPPPQVTVAKPVMRTIVETQEFTGRFDAVQSVEIRSRVNGYLDKVNFIDGSLVKKDDLLFVVDKRTYQTALVQAQANLNSAQSALNFTQSDFNRANALGKTGNITEQLIGQRRQAQETAQANLRGAQAAVDAAKLNMEFTEIKAPINGKISRRLITEGNLVSADTTLLTTLISTDPIYFYFDVDERTFLSYQHAGFSMSNQLGKASGVKPLEISIQLADEKQPTHKGVMDFIDNRIDGASGTIRLRAVLPNKDQILAPGLFGKIFTSVVEPYQGILIPDEAIIADLDRRMVMVVADDGSVTTKAIQPGLKIDGYRAVREGLSGKETIIIAGLQRARPGQKVSPNMQNLPQKR